MSNPETFTSGVWERGGMAHHSARIETCRTRIAEMERGDIRYYREGPDGRLNVDDTSRMLEVYRQSLSWYRQLLRLWSGSMPSTG